MGVKGFSEKDLHILHEEPLLSFSTVLTPLLSNTGYSILFSFLHQQDWFLMCSKY